VKVRV